MASIHQNLVPKKAPLPDISIISPFPGRAVAGKTDSHHHIFHLTRKSYHEMIAHCQLDLPYEACGLLSGKNGLAFQVWKMKNIYYSPYSFCMDMNELKNVFRSLELKNHQLMGIYHSHPTDIAYPSPEDIAYNHYPEVIQIIISLAARKPIVKAFQYYGNTVIPYKINVTDD